MSCITTTDVNKVYATSGSFITNEFILCAQVLYDLCTNLVAFFYNEHICFVHLRKLQNGVHRDLHRLRITKADLLYLLSSCEFNYVVMITILN